MLRGRQLLADALLLSLPQSLWLTSSSEGTFYPVLLWRFEVMKKKIMAMLAAIAAVWPLRCLPPRASPCSPSARAPLVAHVTDIIHGRR